MPAPLVGSSNRLRENPLDLVIDATRRICADRVGMTRILILTTFDLNEYVYASL